MLTSPGFLFKEAILFRKVVNVAPRVLVMAWQVAMSLYSCCGLVYKLHLYFCNLCIGSMGNISRLCCINTVIFTVFVRLPFNPFQNQPWFLRVSNTSPLKTLWEKEKLLITSNFSFSDSVFYPFGKISAIFIKSEIVVCKLF